MQTSCSLPVSIQLYTLVVGYLCLLVFSLVPRKCALKRVVIACALANLCCGIVSDVHQCTLCDDLFLDWVKSSKYKIYVSSYDFDLPLVKEFAHRSILSATANNKVVERLFCNRSESICLTLF